MESNNIQQSTTEPREVLVSMTLSKTFTINITKGREVRESDIRLEYFLPDEILKIVSKQDHALIRCMSEDAADWDIDNLVVVES